MICEYITYRVVALLKEKNWHITFAESCTGGLAAAELVSVSGASNVFEGSFITYADSAKLRLLQVEQTSVDRCGVVSEEVALQMAQGACSQMDAQVGVGISGIAGPTGATEGKPVGTVCFAFVLPNMQYTVTRQFGDIGRNKVQQESVRFVMKMLMQLLE